MTSYFYSYFQTSSMLKRLLHYALSRLEILEIDALDLEILDIAWGKNSVFEFKNVGLKLKKLETLLHLPPSLELSKASVLLLRLNIPVDIYNSPIRVDVDGVDCQILVKPTRENTSKPAKTDGDRKRRQPYPRTANSSWPASNEGSNIAEENENTDVPLPSATDLAQSFLQTEPEEKRAEFEAAILSETQDFGNSSDSSDDGEIPTGTGTTLTLPTFMARFLQGIFDRLQVQVNNVNISLDVDLPQEGPRQKILASTDPTTFQLRINEIDIEGVSSQLGNDGQAVGDGQKTACKPGKRLISLSEIRGFLISEAHYVSNRAGSSVKSSSSTAHSSVFGGEKTALRSESNTHNSILSRLDRISSGHGISGLSRKTSVESLPLPQGVGKISLDASIVLTDSNRFQDAPEDDNASSISGTICENAIVVGDGVFANSDNLDQVRGSQCYVDDITSMRLSGPQYVDPVLKARTVNESYTAMDEPTMLPTRSLQKISHQRVSHSQSVLSERAHPSDNSVMLHQHTKVEKVGAENPKQATNEDDMPITVSKEDLTKSRFFSHEDAGSMYLSAISNFPDPSGVPGGWASSESDGKTFVPTSPGPAPVDGEYLLDNLEHACLIPTEEAPESGYEAHALFSRTSAFKTCALVDRHQEPRIPQGSGNLSEESTSSCSDRTRITKKVFSLDRVSIYLPGIEARDSTDLPVTGSVFSSSNTGLDHQDDASRSVSANIPGAFSTCLPSDNKTPKERTGHTHPASPNQKQSTGSKNIDNRIEIEIGQASLQFDVSVGRLIFKMVRQLMEALKQKSTVIRPSPPSVKSSVAEFSINAKEISVRFLERLEGVAAACASVDPASLSEDVLLRTTLTGLKINTQNSGHEAKAAISLRKFVFGYEEEKIVSFDAGYQMGASVRDLKASEGIDVSAHVTQTGDTTRFEVSTLPMHISVNLRKLDDTFSWFGGLNSVLNVGSSIASNATITAKNPSEHKPHGVRFEAPNLPENKSLAVQNKADIRIGRVILNLIGSECSVGLETSAVKIVSRDEGMGISLQMIRLSGPHLRKSAGPPAITVEVNLTRIEFLSSPKNHDLERLLALITPSKARYGEDDDILIGNLLRQRNKGAVLRITVEDLQTRLGRLHELRYLPELGEEVSRLATVAKYLPDDDRPGLLTLALIHKADIYVDTDHALGTIQFSVADLEVAQISLPALIAFSVGSLSAIRNKSEELLRAATDSGFREPGAKSPALMARMIGNEMEPVVKIKLSNLRVECRVLTLMTLFEFADTTSQDISASLSASVATLTDLATRQTSNALDFQTEKLEDSAKPLAIDVVLRDCVLGLNPLGSPSKVLLVFTEAHLDISLSKDEKAGVSLELNKASILVVDNVAYLTTSEGNPRLRRQAFDGGSNQVVDLCANGYVSVGYISSVKVVVEMKTSQGDQAIIVRLRDGLFVLESCADSTQTIISVLNSLTPPTTPSTETKYRTKVILVNDLLASLSADAFGTVDGAYNFDDDFGISDGAEDNLPGTESEDFDLDQHNMNNLYAEAIFEDEVSSPASRLTTLDTQDGVLLDSFLDSEEPVTNEELHFDDDHFGPGSIPEGTAHRWNSAKNTYDRSDASKVRKSPLQVSVHDVHVIWNLFDGYDWQHTRSTITKAVHDVESKAIERRARKERWPVDGQVALSDDPESVIEDFLFNSIYIGVPGNRDPRELAVAINQELNDNATETESVATTSISPATSRPSTCRKSKVGRLRLNRSKHHKITFELRGVNADLVVFPPGSGETQSSIDVRVQEFEIFDHVPTSTWRKFATYMQDAGERETGSNMIHIEILNVRPVPELPASEIVLKTTILPLRLHVDQDALDFITRFFEFKDDSVPVNASPGDVPFIQRAEVNSVLIKLDFKPKRVDYGGLRSGHTTEFMNFLVLDEADLELRHTIIYGISGFDKLGKCLNDIWTPDVRNNQLGGVLAGLAPVRSLVNIGGGFQQLVAVPMREYKKDGRIIRSISKGAAAFAKTTGTELVKLGAKVAIGAQTVFQGAEGLLGASPALAVSGGDEEEEEEVKMISLYANQPVGVLQGLRGGYSGLKRDLLLAREAIIAVPGAAMESGSATGALRAVGQYAPTLILRPAIGVAKASGQILMGATNSLDRQNLAKASDKYKRY